MEWHYTAVYLLLMYFTWCQQFKWGSFISPGIYYIYKTLKLSMMHLFVLKCPFFSEQIMNCPDACLTFCKYRGHKREGCMHGQGPSRPPKQIFAQVQGSNLLSKKNWRRVISTGTVYLTLALWSLYTLFCLIQHFSLPNLNFIQQTAHWKIEFWKFNIYIDYEANPLKLACSPKNIEHIYWELVN